MDKDTRNYYERDHHVNYKTGRAQEDMPQGDKALLKAQQRRRLDYEDRALRYRF